TPGRTSTWHAQQISRTIAAIDWDGSGTANTGPADANNFGFTGCTDNQKTDSMNAFNDWANLEFNFRSGANELYGLYPIYPDAYKQPELTAGVIQQMKDQVLNVTSASTSPYPYVGASSLSI